MIRQVNLNGEDSAFAPFMSAEAIQFHYGKHYAAYVTQVNQRVVGLPIENNSLETIVRHAKINARDKLYKNAGQSWNHGFFFEGIARDLAPTGELGAAINQAFGGLEGFIAAFTSASKTHFASGWLWLTADRDGELAITSTQDADPIWILAEATPLLVCDLWEHAYYIDWRNDRTAFVKEFASKWANWNLAQMQFVAAKAGATGWTHP